jgi:hypothetical protein
MGDMGARILAKGQERRNRTVGTALVCIGTWVWVAALGYAEDPPLTRDVPIWEFQNKAETPFYDFNAPPQGMFRSIQFAEGFEEELGFRRTHEIIPLNPTAEFRPDAPSIYVVFHIYPHYESFQVMGICFPEQVDGLDVAKPIAQDAMYMALEDESGYLRLQAPAGGWKPGRYKVHIHAGWQINDTTLLGTMRFTVAQKQ